MTQRPDLGMDMITKRPRTPRDPYTTLTDVQKTNIKKVSIKHIPRMHHLNLCEHCKITQTDVTFIWTIYKYNISLLK